MTTAVRDAPPFDVVGFGVNALDLIGVTDGYPEPDTKAPLLEFDVQGGGVVATALAACARLGLRTRYIGKFGTDFWSRVSLRSLAREGIDVRHVLRAPGSPGHVSLVVADRSSGTRTLFYRRPPAYAIRAEELDRAALTAGRLLHVDGIDAAAALQAVRWAREAGMRVTMDGERIVEGIERVWPLVDLLVCNPGFVRAITGQATLEDGLRDLADRGPSRVAATVAGEGALGLEQGQWVRVPGFRVETVDTNGAGDVFHGACAFGELRGWPLDFVLTFANAVAAMKCRHLGGRRGIPRLPEVRDFLDAHGRRDIASALP
ncbi:MAG TPA: PfkB family carbohydrate kinase [Candidatus Methylomirabilis sp.]